MALRDILTERTDGSDPRDLRLRLDDDQQVRRTQTCVLDLGSAFDSLTGEALDTALARVREALTEAVERGFIESFSIHPKRGTTGNFVSIVAPTVFLVRFNENFELAENPAWHGCIEADWPNWAKAANGEALNRWLGVSDDVS